MNLHAFPRTALATLLMGALLSSISAAQSTESTSAAAPYPPDAPAYSHASLDLRQPSPKPETWLFPITRLNASLPTWLQFGGQFRNRAEGQLGLRYAPVDDGHDLTQLRLAVYVQPSSWFKLVGVTQDSRVFFNHRVPNASPYQNVWDVREAYVQFGNSESGWINVSAGREILSFGDERVIGPSDWVNMGRTFDVARVDLHSAAWQITLFASSVIIPRDGVVDHHNQGNNLHGVYSRFTKLIPHATLEPYLFWRLTPASLRLSENAGLGHMSEVTGGARFAGYLRAIDYDVEMNKQTGSLGNKSIDAWAGHWNAGYTLKDLRFKPRPFVEYNYASGNKNPNSRTWSTHDQIYPSAHDKMDFGDQFGWRNIRDLRAGVEEKLGHKWTVIQVVDNVWLATRNDALYSNSGAISVTAHPNASSAHLGTEIELIAEFKQDKHVTYGLGLTHLFTGRFLIEKTPGKDYNYPFAYLAYVF